MMEQPSGEQNPDAKKPELDRSSGQDRDPKPNPNVEDGAVATRANREAGRLQAETQHSDYKNSSSNGPRNGNDQNEELTVNHTRSKKSVRWSEELVTESRTIPSDDDAGGGGGSSGGSNPYVAASPAPSSSTSFKDSLSTAREVLGRWGKKVGEATRKAEDLAGNTWQHLKTAPSFSDAAMGRIAQGTKILAEGGYEKIFRRTFETVPEEKLQNSYACYLSTSAGPVMGTLYVSTAKLAFCSDNPLSYKAGDKTEWSYYKVISVDNHEFWYMGFLNYDGAVKCLQDVLQACDLSMR